jgi:D-sedoheptulose 7-phosphate isomerase
MKAQTAIDYLRAQIQDNIDTSRSLFENDLKDVYRCCEIISAAFKKGNKLLICGNGGSAADAQHVAAEFVNRFKMNRQPLPAIALTTDSSILTSVGNDSDFKLVFSKQVEALGEKGDVLLALTTSGNSDNIIEAVKTAKKKGLYCAAITGDGSGKLKKIADLCACVPSHDTPRIQEASLLIEHLICDLVEKMIFEKR